MTIFFCPNCQKRVVVSEHIGDYQHECSDTDASNALKYDDVVVTGNWEDYDGSGTKAPQEVLRQGSHNELQGTRGAIEGYDVEETTNRGVRASTHRQRKHIEHIELKNFKDK